MGWEEVRWMRWQEEKKRLKDYRRLEERKWSHPSCCGSRGFCCVTCLCDSRFVILLSRTSEHDFTKQRERSDVHLNAFDSFYIHTDITQSNNPREAICIWHSTYKLLLVWLLLLSSFVSHFGKKASAKWSNINVNVYWFWIWLIDQNLKLL